MSVHQDYPENVPSAKHGTADSLAAPGRVGAGGTNPQKHGKTVGCLCASCDQLPSLKPSAVGTKKRAHPDGCTCITCDCPGDYSARQEPSFCKFLAQRKASLQAELESADPFDALVIRQLLAGLGYASDLYAEFLEQGA